MVCIMLLNTSEFLGWNVHNNFFFAYWFVFGPFVNIGRVSFGFTIINNYFFVIQMSFFFISKVD